MSQTSVSSALTAGYAGMLADTSPSYVKSYAAEAATTFGKFVALGTNKATQVTPLTTSTGQGALAIGIAIASANHEQDSSGVVQYTATETVPVLKRGVVWVETNDAVVAGAVANLHLATGKVTDEAVTTGIEAFTQFSARFLTSTSAAGLAQVEIK